MKELIVPLKDKTSGKISPSILWREGISLTAISILKGVITLLNLHTLGYTNEAPKGSGIWSLTAEHSEHHNELRKPLHQSCNTIKFTRVLQMYTAKRNIKMV